MPLDPSISLEAGKPATNSLISQIGQNPAALNSLVSMGGSLAAGRAMQSAIDPNTGAFSPEIFASQIKNNPMAAPAAMEAMAKAQALSRAQMDQAIIRRQQMQGALSGMLIDQQMWDPKNEGYARKQVAGTLADLTRQGIISTPFAVNEAGNLPINDQGKLDQGVLKVRISQHLFNTLSPAEKEAARSGRMVTIDTGKTLQPAILKPDLINGGMTFDIDAAKAIGKTLTPGEAITQAPGSVVRGPDGKPVQTLESGAVRAPGADIPSVPTFGGKPIGGAPPPIPKIGMLPFVSPIIRDLIAADNDDTRIDAVIAKATPDQIKDIKDYMTKNAKAKAKP